MYGMSSSPYDCMFKAHHQIVRATVTQCPLLCCTTHAQYVQRCRTEEVGSFSACTMQYRGFQGHHVWKRAYLVAGYDMGICLT